MPPSKRTRGQATDAGAGVDDGDVAPVLVLRRGRRRTHGVFVDPDMLAAQVASMQTQAEERERIITDMQTQAEERERVIADMQIRIGELDSQRGLLEDARYNNSVLERKLAEAQQLVIDTQCEAAKETLQAKTACAEYAVAEKALKQQLDSLKLDNLVLMKDAENHDKIVKSIETEAELEKSKYVRQEVEVLTRLQAVDADVNMLRQHTETMRQSLDTHERTRADLRDQLDVAERKLASRSARLAAAEAKLDEVVQQRGDRPDRVLQLLFRLDKDNILAILAMIRASSFIVFASIRGVYYNKGIEYSQVTFDAVIRRLEAIVYSEPADAVYALMKRAVTDIRFMIEGNENSIVSYSLLQRACHEFPLHLSGKVDTAQLCVTMQSMLLWNLSLYLEAMFNTIPLA